MLSDSRNSSTMAKAMGSLFNVTSARAFCHTAVHVMHSSWIYYGPPLCPILDLVLTNIPDLITNVDAIDNLPSTDHDAIQFHLCLALQPQEACQRVLYNYKKTDLSELNATLSCVPWHLIEQCDDLEDSWTLFKDLFFAAVNGVIP